MRCTASACSLLVAALVFANVAWASKCINYSFNRTTMVHLFEWKWNDIATECENFLGPKGYGGIQVSPVQENVIVEPRAWWERYQPISYRWETRSGSEEEFRSMVKRCRAVGVNVYVDVLLNHMSANHENATGTGGSKANTNGLDYPSVPYSSNHFHHPICSVNNYNDVANVRNCELVGLHDLDQSQEYVREKLVGMLNDMVDAGVAGFRVDAAKHMWPNDLEIIYSRVKNLSIDHGFAPGTRPYIFQEVIDYGGEAANKYQYNGFGAVTEFRYGREISNALLGRNPLMWFQSWGEAWALLPSEDALVFIDNHDTQRGSGDVPLTYKNSKLYKMAVAMMLAHPYGNPRVMSSFDFTDFNQGPPADATGRIISPRIYQDNTCSKGWICEHRWRQIYNMVGFRNYVGSAKLANWWDNGSYQIAFCRGDRGFVAINAQKDTDMNQRLNTCLPPGTYCDVISGDLTNGSCTGKSIKVDADGYANVTIRADEEDGVAAFHRGVKVA